MPKKKSDKATPFSLVKLEVNWEMDPEKFQKAYEEGDSSVLDLCVLYCDHERRRLPDWARTELERRVMDEKISTALKNETPASLVMAAVDAAEACEFTGGDRFLIAQGLLEGCGAKTIRGKDFDIGNTRKTWKRRQDTIDQGGKFLVNETARQTFAGRLVLAKRLESKKKIPGKTYADKIHYVLITELSD